MATGPQAAIYLIDAVSDLLQVKVCDNYNFGFTVSCVTEL